MIKKVQKIINDDLFLACELAQIGGAVAMKYFRKNNEILNKNDESPVTIADKSSEAAIREALKFHRPQDAIFGEEEGGEISAKGRLWVIDPIDGTRSFITGNPNWGVLISLVVDGIPQIGVCLLPYTKDIYYAQIGKGAWHNGFLIKANNTDKNLKNYYAIATAPSIFHHHEMAQFTKMANACKEIRYGGDCAAYCWLAQGLPNVVCESGLQIYDFCALAPIINMSGAKITDWQGNNLDVYSAGQVIAAPPQIHQQLLALLA